MEAGTEDRPEKLKKTLDSQFGPGGTEWFMKMGRVLYGMLGLMFLFLPLDDGTRDAVESWENEGGAV
jgi:hypothetical protein